MALADNKKPIILIAIVALLAVAVWLMWDSVAAYAADSRPDNAPIPDSDIYTLEEQITAAKKDKEIKEQIKADAIKFEQEFNKRKEEGRVASLLWHIDPFQAVKYPKRAGESAWRLIKNPNELFESIKLNNPFR